MKTKINLKSPPVSRPLLYLSSGANVNVGRGAESPLHAAVRLDAADQVSVLLDFGADVNLRDGNDQRPVQLAPPGGQTQKLLKSFEGSPTSLHGIALKPGRRMSPLTLFFPLQFLPGVSASCVASRSGI